MRILMSSKSLSDSLKKIDFDDESVLEVKLEDKNTLKIYTEFQEISIQCEGLHTQRNYLPDGMCETAVQRMRRWDFLRQLVSAIEDQPIHIDISHDFLSVEFIY